MSFSDADQDPAAAQAARRNAMLAIGLVVVSLIGFDLMGVLVKTLLPRYSPQELSAYRNVLGVLPSLLLMLYTGEIRLRGSRLGLRQWRLAMTRGLIVALAQLFFYAAYAHLDLATVAALGQANALFTVLIGIALYRDRVGPWRWAAVILGFAGVLLIVRPGSDAFTLAALLPVGAALCYAYSAVTMRSFDREASNALIYLYSASASAMGAIVMASLTTTFHPIRSAADALGILTMSLLGGSAVLVMMLAYRLAPPAVLAPFGYLAILTSFFWGYVIFGEAPLDRLFPGVLLIVGAGGVILWRQNRA